MMDTHAVIAGAATPRDDQFPQLPDNIIDALVDDIVNDPAARFAVLPDQTSTRRRRALQGGVLAALVAGVTAVATLSGSTPQAEAAMWSTTPTSAAGDQRADLEATCKSWFNSPAPAVIAEIRGTSSYVVLADSSQCLNTVALGGAGGSGPLGRTNPAADDGVVSDLSTAVATSSPAPAVPERAEPHVPTNGKSLSIARDVTPAPSGTDVDLQAAGPVLTVMTDGALTAEFVSINGRVGPDVTGVVVHRSGAPDVIATVSNAWFAAWWPSSERPTSITVATTAGSYERLVQSD